MCALTSNPVALPLKEVSILHFEGMEYAPRIHVVWHMTYAVSVSNVGIRGKLAPRSAFIAAFLKSVDTMFRGLGPNAVSIAILVQDTAPAKHTASIKAKNGFACVGG